MHLVTFHFKFKFHTLLSGVTIGAGYSLAQLNDALRFIVSEQPKEKTKTYHTLLKHLRTLAGAQIRNMAVCSLVSYEIRLCQSGFRDGFGTMRIVLTAAQCISEFRVSSGSSLLTSPCYWTRARVSSERGFFPHDTWKGNIFSSYKFELASEEWDSCTLCCLTVFSCTPPAKFARSFSETKKRIFKAYTRSLYT